jgi:hypothetical protein
MGLAQLLKPMRRADLEVEEEHAWFLLEDPSAATTQYTGKQQLPIANTVNQLDPTHAHVSRAPCLNSKSNSRALTIHRANRTDNLTFHYIMFTGIISAYSYTLCSRIDIPDSLSILYKVQFRIDYSCYFYEYFHTEILIPRV